MNVHLIANPTAGNGRGRSLLPRARRAFEDIGQPVVHTTARAGDERWLVAEALDAGATTIAVLGGDGTWSKVARAVLELGADCPIALLAAGTGNDLAKSVGAPARDFVRMARLTAEGTERRIDAGRVNELPFVNIAGFGFDAAVIAATTGVRWLSGGALYGYAALRELFAYPGFTAHALSATHGTGSAGRYLGIFAANGRVFGGAFPIAPDAHLDDGALDVVTLADASAPRRLALFAAALRGAHVRRTEVGVQRIAAMCWHFEAPPIFEADGDLYVADREVVEIACLPGVLRMVASGSVTAATQRTRM